MKQIVETIESQLIQIPAGLHPMSDDRKDRQWEVEIAAFQLSKFQITQELYVSVMTENPSVIQAATNPVENVSWLDAVTFCNKLCEISGLKPSYAINGESATRDPSANGYRLPTEAEWEYACKTGTKKPRYGNLPDIAWFGENSEGQPHKVGQKQPNAWGLYDMLGNVWEWCEDLYDPEVYGNYRVFRGGGWNDPERGCLATNRRRSMPNFKIDDLGFRIARSLS